MRWPHKWLLAGALAIAPAPAFAGETVTYNYDALGRLFEATGPSGILELQILSEVT